MAKEVFNRIGESEIYSENPNFYRKKKDDSGFITSDEVESISKPMTEAKKEFFEHLNDDSLDLDTCDKLNHEWGKK